MYGFRTFLSSRQRWATGSMSSNRLTIPRPANLKCRPTQLYTSAPKMQSTRERGERILTSTQRRAILDTSSRPLFHPPAPHQGFRPRSLRRLVDLWASAGVHPKSCTDLACVYCDTLDQPRCRLGHNTCRKRRAILLCSATTTLLPRHCQSGSHNTMAVKSSKRVSKKRKTCSL
jgi:hypothetical protein